MSTERVQQNQIWKRVLFGIVVVIAATLVVCSGDRWVLAQEGEWTEPTIISAPEGFSWFPDLAVDPFGSVHVIWCWTLPLDKGGLQEQVNYASLTGEGWSEPNDIVPPSADIVRNAIAADLMGNVHLFFGGSVYNRNFRLYHQKAWAGEAWSAATWSRPHPINQGIGYMGDIAVDSEQVIHVIYDDTIQYGDEDEIVRADIFYRRSADGGKKWSVPINLHPSPETGSARPYMELDSSDVIHVTWDEGWDRLSGETIDVFHSVYVSSSDGGKSWSSPTVINSPDETVVQLTVGSDGQGGVMLVWRTTSQDEIFYQWSTDSGQSWEPPSAIPRVFARPWTIPFDMYDMATDSAGHIHLLVVGRQYLDDKAVLGVYHLVWDGTGWSTPTRIFASVGLFPEYPKIVVHEGNQLHTAWFVREENVWDQDMNREVWYSSSQSTASPQILAPLPTPTPVPPTATPSPVPTVTPYPTVSFENTGLPDNLRTDSDDAFRLAIALSPVALVILVVIFVRRVWSRR